MLDPYFIKLVIKFKPYTNTDELIKLYSTYYAVPSLTNLRKLYMGIISYNFKDYNLFLSEMEKIEPSKTNDFTTLFTNTGSVYEIGPNPYDILKLIENYLQYKHLSSYDKKLIYVDDAILTNVQQPILKTGATDGFVTSKLQTFKEELKAFSKDKLIIGKAYAINQIQDVAAMLINVNVPCFIKQTGIYINDQMINWKTGLNFWTCINGHKHFLPIFIKRDSYYLNLLNFNRIKQPIDDHFEIKSEFVKCECGKFRCSYYFIPHVNNFFTDQNYDELINLANKLVTPFRFVQFVEIEGQINLFYTTDKSVTIDPNDVEIIKNQFNKPVQLMKNQCFQVGAKLPAFWRVD